MVAAEMVHFWDGWGLLSRPNVQLVVKILNGGKLTSTDGTGAHTTLWSTWQLRAELIPYIVVKQLVGMLSVVPFNSRPIHNDGVWFP